MQRTRFVFGALVRLPMLARLAMLVLLTCFPGLTPLAVSATPCAPATLTIDLDNQGVPVVHATGDPVLAYVLQATGDLLAPWLTLAPFTGSLDYVDPDAPLLPARYYRAVCVESGAVLSQNAVGYVKVKRLAGQRAMAIGCLNAPGGLPPTVSQLIGGLVEGQIPLGTTVHVWNGVQFESAVLGESGWINDPLVLPGFGFWIDVDDANDPHDIYMIGEVPTQELIVVSDIQDDLVGVPYPVDVVWDDTALAGMAPFGSTMTIWNGTTFVDYVKSPMGWSGNPVTLTAGEAVFLSTGVELNLNTCAKPYDWP